jgi:hypothetical protein
MSKEIVIIVSILCLTFLLFVTSLTSCSNNRTKLFLDAGCEMDEKGLWINCNKK